jgi:uncharacterized membrane protein
MTPDQKKQLRIIIALLSFVVLCCFSIGYIVGFLNVKQRESNAYYKGLNTHFTYRVDTVWYPVKK